MGFDRICRAPFSFFAFHVFFGAPSKVWQNLQTERCLPYELTVA
jgi:hypothetical protein